MSKIIQLTQDMMDQCRAEFAKSLEKAAQDFEDMMTRNKIENGKINFSFGNYVKSFETKDRKAELYFTENAWLKMDALIQGFSTEVAWHGVAFRDDDETKDAYYITDIIVYPQKIASATVETDQEEYQNWLYSLTDEQFNNLRMQGHSHVNMGVTPSGVDINQQGQIIEQMHDDMFYIFMIWNKSHQKTIKIYDLKKNVLFETEDVEVKIYDEVIGLQKFVDNAKSLCKTTTYVSGNYSYKKPSYCDTSAQKAEVKQYFDAKQETKKETKKETKTPKKVNPFTGEGSFRNPTYSYDDDGYIDEDYDSIMRDPFGVYDGPYYSYRR